MRRSFDSLQALVREHLESNAFAGHLFVFTSRRRDRVQIWLCTNCGSDRHVVSSTDMAVANTVAVSPARLVIERRCDVGGILARLPWRAPDAWIVVPVLSGAERIARERRLNAAMHDCGCSTGAAFALTAFFGYLVLAWFSPGPRRDRFEAVFECFVITVVSAAVGKGIGILIARKRLIRELRILRPLLPE
jgi:hypothetical protein